VRWYVIPRLEIESDDIEADKTRLGELLEAHGFSWVSSKTAMGCVVDEAELPVRFVERRGGK